MEPQGFILAQKKKSKTKGINLRKGFSFSKSQALIVIAIIAAVGGYFIYHSFAATSGKITSAYPTVAVLNAGSPTNYWVVASNGGVFSMGSAVFHGSAGNLHLTQPISAAARNSTSTGYWLLGGDGGVFAYNVGFYGSESSSIQHFYRAIVPTPDNGGYWLIGAEGQMFGHGDTSNYWNIASSGHHSIETDYNAANNAGFGSLPGLSSGGIVAAALTSTGRGMYLVSDSGHVYAYGDAVYGGWASYINYAGGERAASIVDYGAGSSGGYAIATSKGNVSFYGVAPRYASTLGSTRLNGPIVSMAYTPGFAGYWLLGSDGGVFAGFGNSLFSGAVTVTPPPTTTTPKPTTTTPAPTTTTPAPTAATPAPAQTGTGPVVTGATYNGDINSCPKYVIKAGDGGTCVTVIQFLLISKGYAIANGEFTAKSFGSTTAAAVRSLQSKDHLSVDGVVGPQTWGALTGTASGSPSTSSGSTTTAGGKGGGIATTTDANCLILADYANKISVAYLEANQREVDLDKVYGPFANFNPENAKAQVDKYLGQINQGYTDIGLFNNGGYVTRTQINGTGGAYSHLVTACTRPIPASMANKAQQVWQDLDSVGVSTAPYSGAIVEVQLVEEDWGKHV